MFSLEPTPFDLQFRLGRIPVRVLPWFWLVGAIGGWDHHDLRTTLVWMLCLFVSILIHELGHAITSEAFGWPSEILLYQFGGLAYSQRYHGRHPWKDIAVSLAGPFAGFTFFGLIFFASLWWDSARFVLDPETHEVVQRTVFHADYDDLITLALFQLEYINLGWGLVNLAPVLPLDGGHVCRSTLEWLGVRDAETRAAQISLPVGGAMAYYFWTQHDSFASTLFVILAIQNLSTLQQQRGRW